MKTIKNKDLIISFLGSIIPLALIIWILVLPVSLTFKITYINLSTFAIFTLFTNKDKRRKIKIIKTVWALVVALLTLLHTLEATGRIQIPF